MIEITHDNYFSDEVNREYWSVSQYNSFVGTDAYDGCEAKAVAKLNGEWVEETSTAMLQGSYVDEYFSDNLDNFKKEHPEMFTLKGELKAPFKVAETVIKAAEEDKFFLNVIKGDGEQQVILKGEIGGMKWKGKIDNLKKGKAITDLKVVASIQDKIWSDYRKERITFIEAYGYIRQGAVYRELHRQMTGEKLPFFIAAITKNPYPDKEVIYIPDNYLDIELMKIEEKMNHLQNIKSGKFPPLHCGKCDYCRANKKLTDTINFIDLIY